MWAVSRAKIRWIRMAAIPLLIGSCALLCLVLVPGIGKSVNGNQNWIDFGGPFRIQPSESAKLALVVWGADLLARKEKLLTQWRHLLVPLVPVTGFVVALVMAGGDLGTTVILLVIVRRCCSSSVRPRGSSVCWAARCSLGVGLLSVTSPHRLSRFKTMLDPEAAYLGAGWQAGPRALRPRQRRLVGSRARRQPAEVGRPPGGRTPTSSSPSSARSSG